MATVIWEGDATAVAQVDTVTPGGTIEAGDKFILTVTGEDGTTYDLSVDATSTTVTQTCTDIVTAWNASTNALLTPITAGYVGSPGSYTAVTLTADTAGVPFYVAASTTESNDDPADDQTFVRAASTANAGPNDWNTATNWSGGAVPVNSDDVYFTNNTVDVLYGLDQSAVTLDSLNVAQSYTGAIGTEDAYLQIGVTDVSIGEHYGSGSPAGSGRIKLDLQAACTSFEVYNSATTATDTYLAPIQVISGANAITTAYVKKGRVGFCVGSPSETAVITTLVMGYDTSITNDAIVELGPGVTVTTISKTGGTLSSLVAPTNLFHDGGEAELNATGNMTGINVKGGTVTVSNVGTVTLYTISSGTCYLDRHGVIATATLSGGVSDWSRTRHARTVTTPTMYAGATVRYDSTVVTFTNKITTSGRVAVQAQAA